MAGIAPRRGVSYPWPRPYLTHPPLQVLVPTRPIGQQTCGYVATRSATHHEYLVYEQVRASVQLRDTANTQAQSATVSEQKSIISTAALSVQRNSVSSVQTWRGLTKPAAKCRLRLNYKLNLQNEQGLSYIYHVRLLSAVRAPCYQDVLPLDNNLFLFFFLPFFPIRPPSGSLFLYICMQMALSYDVTSSGLLNISGDSERTFCLRNIHPSYTASRPWWLQSSRSPKWDRRFHMPSTDMSSPTQHSGHYTYHQFNIHQFYVLSTQFIYLFCADLKTNSDYFPIQH